MTPSLSTMFLQYGLTSEVEYTSYYQLKMRQMCLFLIMLVKNTLYIILVVLILIITILNISGQDIPDQQQECGFFSQYWILQPMHASLLL